MEPTNDGHNGRVPVLREPSPEMPAEAVRAQKMMSLVRLDIARFLMAKPESTIGEVMKATGLSRNSAQTGLRTIEDIGYLVVDPPGERRGHHSRYSIDRKAFMAAFNELQLYTFG